MYKLLSFLTIGIVIFCIDVGAGLQCKYCLGESAKSCDNAILEESETCNEEEHACIVFNGFMKNLKTGKQRSRPVYGRGCINFDSCDEFYPHYSGEKEKDNHCMLCTEDDCNDKNKIKFQPIPAKNPDLN